MAQDTDDLRVATPLDTLRRWWGPPRQYRLTRLVVLRLIGVVYLFAFLGLLHQGLPLLGERGLTPVADFLARVSAGGQAGQVPTLFWLDASDSALEAAAWLGLALSIVVVAGFANLPILLALWLLYGSFVHTGQTWFSFGWEIQLLETGVLAAFLAPTLDPRPLAPRTPPRVVIALFGWLAFRIMLGAGLIKLRGDPCWRELTCLDWHFETQPIPNPLSPWFHALPHGVLATGVVVNHVCELVCPWLLLGPRRVRLFGAVVMIAFQLMLIASGNLSFLNWLTLVPLVAMMDDDAWRRLLPARARRWLDRHPARPPSRGHTIAAWLLAGVVAILSLAPIGNLISSDQSMNRSYDRLALVNTYGAFGSVGETRDELIIEGTTDDIVTDDTVWQAYELPCKPGDPLRRPCVLGPYHLRLDWLMWFAAMSTPDRSPWAVHLVHQLLSGEPGARELLSRDPFAPGRPRYVRVLRYRYHFAPTGERAWWTRTLEGEWLPQLTVDDPRLTDFIAAYGWRY